MVLNQRIKALDALRGIGVLMVVLFHYTFRYYEYYPGATPFFSFPYGRLGVELFFLISGFVIFMTAEKTASGKIFMLLRISRLFPAYWFAIIFTFVIVAVFGLPGLEVSWKTMLFNFSMTQELFDVANVDPSYWSLFPELVFYAIIACLLALKKSNYFDYVFSAWMLFIVVNLFTEIPMVLQKLFNLQYGLFFIAGIQFYKLKKKQEQRIIFSALPLFLLFTSLIVLFFRYDLISTLIINLFYGLFFLLVMGRLNFLAIRPLLFLGAISYPFYLVHTCLGFIVMNQLNLEFWTELLLACCISGVTACGMHYFIEKPAMGYLRRKWVKAPLDVLTH